MQKRCKVCGVVKGLDGFYKAVGGRDGRRNDCKQCNLAAKAARYKANPKPEIERVRRWQRENRDRVNAYQRAYRSSHRAESREGHLRRTFGITQEGYDALLAKQRGGCAICGCPPREGSSLHVDHDHETGAVRGLLCFRCNGGGGQFAEDEERLLVAAAYFGMLDPLHDIARERALALRGG